MYISIYICHIILFFYYIKLYHSTIYFIILYYIILYYFTLFCFIFYYIVVYYIICICKYIDMCVCARICVYIHICCLFVSNSIIISAYYHAYVRISINIYVNIHINCAQTHFYLLFIFTNVDMCNQFLPFSSHKCFLISSRFRFRNHLSGPGCCSMLQLSHLSFWQVTCIPCLSRRRSHM